jgi:hypothetical protein
VLLFTEATGITLFEIGQQVVLGNKTPASSLVDLKP